MGTGVQTAAARVEVERSLEGGRRDWSGGLLAGLLLLCLLLSLAVLVVLLGQVALQGIPVIRAHGVGFFTNANSTLPANAGIRQALIGSLLLVGIVGVVAIPLGVGAAVYLEEYAPDSALTRFIRANVRNLAGVPSIVYGILGLIIFVLALRKLVTNMWPTGSLISGGLTLSALVLPIVVITTSEALRAVPSSIREAAFGVGATKWETIRSHVLPAAAPGIFTGTVLTLARAFGETAPLILVGAIGGFFAPGGSGLAGTFLGPYTALPILIFDWTRRPQPEFQDLAAAAIVVMMVVILLVNCVAIWLRNRYERAW